MKRLFFFFLIFSSSLWVSNLWAESLFRQDSSHSSVEFSIKHLGLLPVKGRFKKFTAQFEYDEKNHTAKKVEVKMDVDSIDTNEEDRDAHLKGDDFFQVRDKTYDLVEKNRYIVFRADKIKAKKKGRKFFLKGNLKILNTEKPVTFDAKVHAQKDKSGQVVGLILTADTKIRRQDFGLNWQKEGTSALKKAAGKFVGDKVKIHIAMMFLPAEKSAKKSIKK